MHIRKKRNKKCPVIAHWMTTFTDMTTLLLTFFILMFTTAEIDGHKLRLILSSFVGSFGVMRGGLTLQKGPAAESGMMVESLPSSQQANKLAKAFYLSIDRLKINSLQMQKNIRIKENFEGFIISLPGRVYFEPGRAYIKDYGKLILDKIAYLLLDLKANTGIDSQISINGYASIEPDTLKINDLDGVSQIWETNLDLSIERAKNVEKFLIKRFSQIEGALPFIKKSNGRQIAKFVAKGYGEFQPYEDANTPESRAWNRRVDIVIQRD